MGPGGAGQKRKEKRKKEEKKHNCHFNWAREVVSLGPGQHHFPTESLPKTPSSPKIQQLLVKSPTRTAHPRATPLARLGALRSQPTLPFSFHWTNHVSQSDGRDWARLRTVRFQAVTAVTACAVTLLILINKIITYFFSETASCVIETHSPATIHCLYP